MTTSTRKQNKLAQLHNRQKDTHAQLVETSIALAGKTLAICEFIADPVEIPTYLTPNQVLAVNQEKTLTLNSLMLAEHIRRELVKEEVLKAYLALINHDDGIECNDAVVILEELLKIPQEDRKGFYALPDSAESDTDKGETTSNN